MSHVVAAYVWEFLHHRVLKLAFETVCDRFVPPHAQALSVHTPIGR